MHKSTDDGSLHRVRSALFSDESDLNLAGCACVSAVCASREDREWKAEKGLIRPLVEFLIRKGKTLDLDTVDAPSAVNVLRLAGGC